MELGGAFISHYLEWKSPFKQYNRIEKCFCLNFGSKSQVEGLAMISMELEMDLDFDQLRVNDEDTVWKGGIRSTQKRDNFQDDSNDNCFLVFIGGKYVRVLDQIMKKVENISQKIGLLPLGLFVTSHVENTMNLKATFSLVKCKDVDMLLSNADIAGL